MMIQESHVSCYSCNKPLDLKAGQKVVKSEECPHCYANIHSCMMCKFYDKSAYNECREPSADRIVEKEKANFCDYFVLTGGQGSSSNTESLLDAANSLFKD